MVKRAVHLIGYVRWDTLHDKVVHVSRDSIGIAAKVRRLISDAPGAETDSPPNSFGATINPE